MNNENISSHGISKGKRDYYMTILRNSKELTDSIIGEEQFKITNMHFRKDKLFGRQVVFSGNISSGSEERYITGTIYDLWNKVFLKDCVVMRIGVPIEEDGIITFGEGFSLHDDYDIRRITRYNDTDYVYRKIEREEFFNPVIEQQVLVRGK